ncbi:MAG: lysophospholipid acyltransferase family protein [Burkholderiales bacterium]
MIWLRSALFSLSLLITTPIFCAIALLSFACAPLTRYRAITLWSRITIFLARTLCGVRFRVTGAQHLPSEPAIVLSKHQSAWETLAFQVIFPPQAWVVKKSLLRVPFLGWGMAMLNPISIDRGSGAKALKRILEQGRQRLEQGFWVVIFPEGTRVAPGTKGKYGIGGAWLATRTHAKVVPVAHNAGEFWPRHGFLKRPGLITVSIGESIDPTGMKPAELMARVEQWVENETRRIGGQDAVEVGKDYEDGLQRVAKQP